MSDLEGNVDAIWFPDMKHLVVTYTYLGHGSKLIFLPVIVISQNPPSKVSVTTSGGIR